MTNIARWLAFLMLIPLLGWPGAVRAQDQEAQDDKASVRVIHAVSDLGPIDVYIDDALAVVGAAFPSVTDPLMIPGGEHRVTVTPSGYGVDQALIDSVIAIDAGTTDEIAVIGTAQRVGAVLFPMDQGELDEDRGRIRVVHASPDAGPLDPIVANGDQLFPTVQFQQATEYAEAPLGLFPMAMLFDESQAVALDLPELALESGTVTDLYIVGRVADGTIQPVIVRGQAKVVPLSGFRARLVQGACVENGATLQEIGVVGEPRGRVVGSPAGEPVNSANATVPVSFDQIVGSVTSIEVRESEKSESPVAACAEIGGPLADDGALAVALRGRDGGQLRGVAVFAPSVLDPLQTDISVMMVAAAPGASAVAAAEPPAAILSDQPTAAPGPTTPVAGAATPAP